MTSKDLIPFFEAKMLKDIQQFIDDQKQLGGKVENVGLLMNMLNSKEKLKEVMEQSQFDFSSEDIDSSLDEAYYNLFKHFFETEKDKEKPSFQSLFVGTIRFYNKLNDDPDLDLFVINVVAGKAPNTLLIHREEAEEAGLYLNKSYLINCKSSEFGNEITSKYLFEATGELNAIEILSAVDKLGIAEIIEV
ncbi:MAG: hypothetical protein B7Z06_10900 [Flavobacteriales bacterium 32-35-8]|nr:MAG: hypothetical protein B7Z06_10900 [Flavobacteriales bacterium 32-35-8]